MSYFMADRTLLEVLKTVGHTFVMDFRKTMKGMKILPVIILKLQLNHAMTLIIISIDNILLNEFVLQINDAIEDIIVTFFFSENLILISSVDAGYEICVF